MTGRDVRAVVRAEFQPQHGTEAIELIMQRALELSYLDQRKHKRLDALAFAGLGDQRDGLADSLGTSGNLAWPALT